ncbi:MAG: hypothetical protein KatS3mg110_0087 [Pirellulaceae bacterium]|nr:MAG: hypothetical protein KatS3mg110_0087 [Pirellulaceae bacterium]
MATFHPPHQQPDALEVAYSQQLFQHPHYVVRRKVFQIFGASFHIYDSQGRLAFYSKQKAFRLKEDIRLYTGEDMTTEILTLKARRIIDFSATYDVIDTQLGKKVGALRRRGVASLLRDTWEFVGPNDEALGEIKEDTWLAALIRRFLINIVPQSYTGTIHGQVVCRFKQNFNPFVQKIILDFTPDTSGLLDRRLGIAAAILLCAIEGRQR